MKKITGNGLILVTIIWLVFIMVISLRTLQQPKFGLVDTQRLIANQAKKIASIYPNGSLPPEKLLQLAEQIKNSVETYVKDHNVILLAKGAVWGSELPDYTENIITELTE